MTRYVLHILITSLILCDPAGAAVRSVWIDADPSCGLGRTDDVDDCWAIIAAVRSSDLKVVGVSTVFGNVRLEQATGTARTVLDAIAFHEPRRDTPSLHEGADRSLRQGAGNNSPALSGLAAALNESRLTIVALGPLTNVAALIKNHPALIGRIDAVIAVAGQRPGQVFRVGTTPILHFHDMNVRKDPDAFDIVLRSGVPLHLIPFEVGQQVVVTLADLQTLERRGALDAWVAARSFAWLDFWMNVLGAPGFSPFDALAIAYVVNYDQFTCQATPVKLVRRHGLFTVRDTLEVSSSQETGYPDRFCSEVTKSVQESPIGLLLPAAEIPGVGQ
jgi:pyrimidine-specific ribonucleoside hydrolase